MTVKEKQKGGAPKGNQNARKHGFYSNVLNAAEKRRLTVASDVEGIDDEIAVLRVKIKTILEKDPENIKLLVFAVATLANLMKARLHINKDQGKSLLRSLLKLGKEVALTSGASAVSELIVKKMGQGG
jgi:hypothetical protein